MSKTVLILGAGVSYLNILEAASETGYRIIATDQNADAPGFDLVDHAETVDITNIEGTLRVAKEYDVEGIVPINDHGIQTAAIVADELNLPGIRPEVAEICTDKAAMRREWKQAGISQPEFGVVTTISEAADAFDTIGAPIILKPANSIGGGSRGVSIVENRKELERAFEFAQSAYKTDDRVLVEECLQGSEHSIEVVVHNNNAHVLAISDKEKTPPPYRVDKSVIYPSNSQERDAIASVAQKATSALGIDFGAAHVELCVTDSGPQMFELGARCGGGATASPIVPAVTGIQYFQELLKLHAGDEPESLEPKRCDGVTYRFLTPDPGRLEAVHGVETVRSWDGILACEIWQEPGDKIPPIRVGSDRSGAVISHAETRTDGYQLACEAEDYLEFVVSGDN